MREEREEMETGRAPKAEKATQRANSQKELTSSQLLQTYSPTLMGLLVRFAAVTKHKSSKELNVWVDHTNPVTGEIERRKVVL